MMENILSPKNVAKGSSLPLGDCGCRLHLPVPARCAVKDPWPCCRTRCPFCAFETACNVVFGGVLTLYSLHL